MPSSTEERRTPRTLPAPRKSASLKINPDEVLRLAKAGLSTVDIAKHQGVQRTTVWRFLQQHQCELTNLVKFKEHRADILASLQGDALDLQKRIISSFDDGMIGALKPSEKTGLLMALNATHGTTFDKERLERGQSTQNVSLIGKMMAGAFESAHKAPEPTPIDAGKLGS